MGPHSSPEAMDWSPAQPRTLPPRHHTAPSYALDSFNNFHPLTINDHVASRLANQQNECPSSSADALNDRTGQNLKSNPYLQRYETLSKLGSNPVKHATQPLSSLSRSRPLYAGIQKTSSSLHNRSEYLSISPDHTKTARAIAYRAGTRPSLRQLFPSLHDPIYHVTNDYDPDYYDPSITFNRRKSIHSTLSTSYLGTSIHQRNSIPKPSVSDRPRIDGFAAGQEVKTQESRYSSIPGAFPNVKPDIPKRKFDEFAAAQEVDTQESRHLAVPGAFPNITSDTAMLSQQGPSADQSIIYQIVKVVGTAFNFAVERTRKIGRCFRQANRARGPHSRQATLPVIQTYRAAVQVAGGCKRRMVEYMMSRDNTRHLPEDSRTPDTRNERIQGNPSNQPAALEHPNPNNGDEATVAQLGHEEGLETSIDVRSDMTPPSSQPPATATLSLAQGRAIQEAFQKDHYLSLEDAMRGDLSKRIPKPKSEPDNSEDGSDSEDDSAMEDAGPVSTAPNLHQHIESSQHESSSKKGNGSRPQDESAIEDAGSVTTTPHFTQHNESSQHESRSKKGVAKSQQTTASSAWHPDENRLHSASRTAKATVVEGGDEMTGLVVDNSTSDLGLTRANPQSGDIASPLAESIAKVHISDRRRSTRQREKEAAEQRAEALKQEKAEAAARVEREARLAEAARVAQEQAKAEAQWVKLMGRSAMPSGCTVLEPVAREWQQKVTDAMTRPSTAELATVSNGTKLTRKDFETVLPRLAWLNDEVIAAYIQLSVDHVLEQTGHTRGQTPKIHAFNSFFYKNLSTKGPASIARWAGRAKVGGKDLKNVDTIFIPVNPGVHWTLLVVSPSKRTIEYFDSLLSRSDLRKPFPTSNVYTDNVKKWLKQEMGNEYIDAEWTVRIRNDGPQQKNSSDCGVFTITTAKLIAMGYDPVGAYDASVMPALRIRVVAELMASGWVGSAGGDHDAEGDSHQGLDGIDEEEGEEDEEEEGEDDESDDSDDSEALET